MSQSKEIILNSLCRNVTTRAKIAFLLISVERALKTIEGKVSTIYPENSNEANEIYEWFSRALNDGWIWLTNLEMKGKAYYEKYFIDQPPIYTGYYEYGTLLGRKSLRSFLLGHFKMPVKMWHLYSRSSQEKKKRHTQTQEEIRQRGAGGQRKAGQRQKSDHWPF